MAQPFKDQMSGATRLVRSGRLTEATALIMKTLKGEAADVGADGGGLARLEGAIAAPFVRLRDSVADAAERSPTFGGLRNVLNGLPGFGSPDAGGNAAAADPETDPAGAFLSARFAGGAGSRPYKLYVPSSYTASSAMPLVVMLHGCTQSPDDFAAGTRMNALAERDGILVCYPGQTAAANGSRCWNWFNDGDQHRDRGEPALIAGITREVMATYNVDPRRVYVAGLSAGGALAATMGQRYPDLYAAVGVHSGLACGAAHDASSAFMAMRQGGGARATAAQGAATVPTIVFHGDRDTTVNPVNGDEVAAQTLSAAALRTEVEDAGVPDGRLYRRTRFVDESGRAVVEQWSIHGAGHAWAGGSTAGSYTDPKGPDASREMLRFFAEHEQAPRP